MLRRFVLIFHQAALGDLVLAWPLILAVARVRPQQRVVVVAASQKAGLTGDVLGVEAGDAEAWGGLFAESPQLAEPQMKRLRQAAEVFSFVSRPGETWAKNVADLSGGAGVVCLDGRPAGAGHVADAVVAQITDPTIRTAAEATLRLARERGLAKTGDPAGPVLVHPGSGSPAKNWPAEKFADLLNRLRAAGRRATLVLGEVERETMPKADRDRLAAAADAVAEPADLAALHALLKTAAAHVGNDSGPTHLAAILGLPTLALFGPTDPARWSPLGPRVTVLDHAATPADVAAALPV